MAGIRKREWKSKTGVKKNCWEITYYLNGKLVRKSGFKTRLEAQNALPAVTKGYDSNVIIEDLAFDYLNRHCALHCKESTREIYQSYLKVNLKEIKKKKAKDLKKRDIENLIFKWKKDSYVNKSINSMLIFLQSLYHYGIENGLLNENPVSKVKKLPPEKKKIRFLSEDEIKIFLEKAKELTPNYFALFYTAIFTGMRRGELLALEWNDIDFKKQTININKQVYRGRLSDTKTFTSTRTINIPNSLAHILYEHKKVQKIISKIVFCNQNGGYLHPYNMSETYYKKVLKAVSECLGYENNVDKLRFHDLRHTYATYLLSKNVPVKYVQEQLGHASSRVTLDTYGHVMPSVKSQVINILDELKSEHKMSMKNLKA